MPNQAPNARRPHRPVEAETDIQFSCAQDSHSIILLAGFGLNTGTWYLWRQSEVKHRHCWTRRSIVSICCTSFRGCARRLLVARRNSSDDKDGSLKDPTKKHLKVCHKVRPRACGGTCYTKNCFLSSVSAEETALHVLFTSCTWERGNRTGGEARIEDALMHFIG